MPMNPKEMLDRYFLEMRWRCLSLAADLDRVERAKGAGVASDARLTRLHQAIVVLTDGKANRAERVQMIFSDMSPPPKRND